MVQPIIRPLNMLKLAFKTSTQFSTLPSKVFADSRPMGLQLSFIPILKAEIKPIISLENVQPNIWPLNMLKLAFKTSTRFSKVWLSLTQSTNYSKLYLQGLAQLNLA